MKLADSSLLSASTALERGWTPGGALLEPSAMGRKGVPGSQAVLTRTGEPAPCPRALTEKRAAGASAGRQGGAAGTWVEGGLLGRQ